MKGGMIYIDEDLLIRYLAGETTGIESEAVERWLPESEANRQKLASFRALFEESKALIGSVPGDADKSWARFKQRVDERENAIAGAYPFKKWLSIAAIILSVLSVGAWFYLQQQRYVSLYAHERPLTDSLPDGSMIALSSHSALSFRSGKIREATLQGEAFFEVKHDTLHPFRIRVNDVLIQVLGTSFNIKTIGRQTEVKVRTGLVSVSGGNQFIQLQAGEKLLATPGLSWQKQAQTSADFGSYNGWLQLLLKYPGKWPGLLKYFSPRHDTIEKALVRSIIHQLISEGIVADGGVQSFRLDHFQLIINRVAQPANIFQRYKVKYLTPPLEFIYFGKEHPGGKGIIVNSGQF